MQIPLAIVHRRRVEVLRLAWLAAILSFICLAPACAASQRESTIKAALITTDAARDAFIAYDDTAQDKIVTAATSLEQGRAALADYREKRARYVTAFAVAYRAIAVAVTLNDQPSLTGMQAAVAQVLAAVAAVTGGGK